MFWTKLGYGVAAGAAGVTTLNAITYLDMAVRAPVQRHSLSGGGAAGPEGGRRNPGQGDDRDNRLAGLGPLAGIMTGTIVAVAAAFGRPILARIPSPLAAAALGALAMTGSDGPLVALGLTRPGEWAAADWASDIIPHLGYGAAVYATLTALDTERRKRMR
jgi:hypothetical protein